MTLAQLTQIVGGVLLALSVFGFVVCWQDVRRWFR
jgi:hypothetical protein